MKKIYLDYQFIIDEVDNRKDWKLSNIERENYCIVYSPAHIEEIVRGEQCKKLKKEIFHYIKFLSDITQNKQLIRTDADTAKILDKPFGDDGIYLVEEDPIFCYKRVFEFLEKNIISEEGQQQVFDRGHEKFKKLTPKNKQKKVETIQKLDIQDILQDEAVFNNFLNKVYETYLFDKAMSRCNKKFRLNKLDNDLYRYVIWLAYQNITQEEKENIRKHIEKILYSRDKVFERISSQHSLVENIIDNLMKTILEYGFYLEPKQKAVSNLHDTTHCIYAAYSDFFITRDKKLKYKVEAIYKYLGVKTQVIFVDSSDNEDILVDRFGKP